MFLAMLAAAALVPGVAHAADYPTPSFDLRLDDYAINTADYRFPSGIRILFQEDHTQPIVSVTQWIDHGSIYDGVNSKGESVEGIAHVVEHLAFRAKHGDLPKNWDVINQLGGILNASTSSEWTNYMTVAPVDAVIPLLRIEALRLHDGVAGVTEADVEAEKAIARNELRMGYEMGSNGSAEVRTALVHLPKLLWPEDHPYRNTTIGSHETIANIDLASVQRYVRENYRPEYSTIAVVGDLDLEGGNAMDIIFRSFAEVEHLLMAPEDAEAYQKLTTAQEKDEFFGKWIEGKLVPYLNKVATEPAPPRVDCSNRAEPPPLQSTEVIRVKGMVDRPTAVVAWSLPGGYCEDDGNMNAAASFLQSYIQRSLDPNYNPLSGESDIEGFGCGAFPDKTNSVLFCIVGQGKLNKKPVDALFDQVADALYMQTMPIDQVTKPFIDNNLAYSRLFGMSNTLSMTDNIASLYGRSFYVAQHTHYTGMPTFFSDTIRSNQTLQLDPIREIGRKYITRERMARVVIEPMDEEERERLEANASEADKDNNVEADHRAKDDRSRQLFDSDQLTPEAIKAVTVVPEVEKMKEFTLDNGLHVVIMNHGEAPLAKVGLQVSGDNAVAPQQGLDSLSDALRVQGSDDWRNPQTIPLRIAGSVGSQDNFIYASGSSGNIEQLVYSVRRHLDDVDFVMADKAQQIKAWVRGAKANGKEPEVWASRMRNELVFKGHPYGRWWRPADYEVMKDWGKAEVEEWYHTKWQPQNAYLVVVGKVDPAETERAIREYFTSWEYGGSGSPGNLEAPPAPTQLPDRTVLLFDKPIATQSKVTLACPVKKESDAHVARTQVIGELFTFFAFERLREEKGLTYGAYAYPQMLWGDTSALILGSVIQNSGAAYGVKTFFDIVAEGADGRIDEGLVATNKWNVARTSVTGIQSGDQMLNAIMAAGRDNLDYFREYPDNLANVTIDDFKDALSTCKGHEVVTVVGPVEKIKGQFDEMNIPVTVVDWEAEYLAQLSPKEQKKYQKSKAEKEAEAAKKAAEGGAAEGFTAP